MPLKAVRMEIDAVDSRLVQLLEERMRLVERVLVLKRETGQPILDSDREKAVLDKVAQGVEEESHRETILAIFSDMMKHSRAYQNQHLGGQS